MNFLTLVNGLKTFVRSVDFVDISNSAFRIRLTGTSTADRVVTLPNESGTVLLKEPPIGSATFGYTSGRLVSSNGPNGSKSFNYNTDGSIASITQTVGAITRVRSFSYDSGGVLISISTI